jgi:hypothetical protein
LYCLRLSKLQWIRLLGFRHKVIPNQTHLGRGPDFGLEFQAASQAMTALNSVSQDEEGNVHGVDASSLLAVTNVGRESTRYEQLDDGDNANQK